MPSTGVSIYWRIACVARFWSFKQWKIFSFAWLCYTHLIQMLNFFKDFLVRVRSRSFVLLNWQYSNRQYCKNGIESDNHSALRAKLSSLYFGSSKNLSLILRSLFQGVENIIAHFCWTKKQHLSDIVTITMWKCLFAVHLGALGHYCSHAGA